MKLLDAFYSGPLTRDTWARMKFSERRRAFLSDIAVAAGGLVVIYFIFRGH